MGKGYKHGTSGNKKEESPLNFAVIAYPSEVELNTATPEDTTIITIGVATTNPITGWHFASKQPETMEEGNVWFSTGNSSNTEFNALKQNNIMVYPLQAQQMVSGSLKNVTAKCYKDGQWIDWTTYIFKTGQGAVVPLCTSLETSNVLVTINTEKIIVDATTSSECMSRVGTEEPIDITNYKSLCIEVQTTYRGVSNSAIMERQKFVFGVSKEKPGWGDGENSKYAASQFVDSNSASEKYTLDISALTGEYYASFGGFIDANVDNWWLE